MPRAIVYPHAVKTVDHGAGKHTELVSGCPLCIKAQRSELRHCLREVHSKLQEAQKVAYDFTDALPWYKRLMLNATQDKCLRLLLWLENRS